MNLIRNCSLIKPSRTSVQLVRTKYNGSKEYEEIPGRMVENRRYGYRSRYHETGKLPE